MSGISLQWSGKSYSVACGSRLMDFLASLPKNELPESVVASLNGDIVDFHTPLSTGGDLEFFPLTHTQTLATVRHSTSHIMAEAVQKLFPGTKVTIGPSIENGFYYDFDLDHAFTPDDLKAIEKEMRRLTETNLPFVREEMPSAQAAEMFRGMGETYKVELIEGIGAESISLYHHGDWLDLCRGPHLPDTRKIRTFKLQSVAGAYWRGDEHNKMLQRIYGTAFLKKEDLEEYLRLLEEAKKRDHRILGRKLDLFSFSDEAGAGMVIYHPRGMRLRTLIEDWEKKEHFRRGYEIVQGPTILKKELWIRSGHYDNYRDNMYFTKIEDVEYGIKPMNCLAHMLIYKSALRSFRDLPQRYFELGVVHRHEKSGVLNGLFRVRCFTQDDAHILCTPEQINDEIKGVVAFVQDTMNVFGFDYKLEISTKPEKRIGADEVWDRATDTLKTALDELGLPYVINEGDGAFYGPKIDVKLKDCLGREWQCATIQCDFFLPERFDLTYVGPDNAPHRPVMIHRVILGSMERFIGVLIEHFAGAFPVWLAPVQAVVMTISERFIDHGKKVSEQLRRRDVRVVDDFRNEKIGYKIREWQGQKVPYMLIIGEKEAAEGTVSPRTRKGEQPGAMSVDEFLTRIEREVAEKAID